MGLSQMGPERSRFMALGWVPDWDKEGGSLLVSPLILQGRESSPTFCVSSEMGQSQRPA